MKHVRLPQDYYVRVLGNDYSVDPAAIGRMITVRADLHRVTATLEGRLVATHPRGWGSTQTITDPVHVAEARRLREEFQTSRPVPVDADLVKDLVDYDTVFGVHIEGISA